MILFGCVVDSNEKQVISWASSKKCIEDTRKFHNVGVRALEMFQFPSPTGVQKSFVHGRLRIACHAAAEHMFMAVAEADGDATTVRACLSNLVDDFQKTKLNDPARFREILELYSEVGNFVSKNPVKEGEQWSSGEKLGVAMLLLIGLFCLWNGLSILDAAFVSLWMYTKKQKRK